MPAIAEASAVLRQFSRSIPCTSRRPEDSRSIAAQKKCARKAGMVRHPNVATPCSAEAVATLQTWTSRVMVRIDRYWFEREWTAAKAESAHPRVRRLRLRG